MLDTEDAIIEAIRKVDAECNICLSCEAGAPIEITVDTSYYELVRASLMEHGTIRAVVDESDGPDEPCYTFLFIFG